MELKPGDVVILKSGGHPITVAEVNDDTSSASGSATKATCFARHFRSPSSKLPKLMIRRKRTKTRTKTTKRMRTTITRKAR